MIKSVNPQTGGIYMEHAENQLPENQKDMNTVAQETQLLKQDAPPAAETKQPVQENTENQPIPPSAQGQTTQSNGGREAPWTPYSRYPQPQFGYQPPQGKRRESPFANSPYVMNPAWQTQSAPQNPLKPKTLEPKVKPMPKKIWRSVIAGVLVLALVVGSCFVTAAVVDYNWQKQATDIVENFNTQIRDLEKQIQDAGSDNTSAIPGNSGNTGNYNGNTGNTVTPATGTMTPAQVYARNVESVVLIHNMIRSGNGQTGYSTGSGFIMTEDGYVVTNNHVIEGNGTLTVITNDGTEYPAEVVGSDNTNDVALLKIDADKLQAVTIGSSDALVVGDQVAAIGNPLGELTSTLTVGYVSAKERDVNTDGFAINMLQTDAAINSGNSGGPLFNMKGEVVGITTAKYSGTSSSGASIEGVGFAIPIDDVIGLLNDLATYGYVNSAYMGVGVGDMDPEAADYYGMPVGAYVQSVEPDSPAYKAGIREKDIIVKLGNYKIENVNDLSRALRNLNAGETVTVIVYRSGAEVKLTITLAQKPVTN